MNTSVCRELVRVVNLFVLAMTGGWLVATPASAQTCMQDIAGFNLNCTANDVRLSRVFNPVVAPGDGCTGSLDTITFSADIEVELTAQARYDIGIYLGTDGLQALTGMCETLTLPLVTDLDGDACGDIDDDPNPIVVMGGVSSITVPCVDNDGDGQVDLPNCESWRQPGSNELCLGILDAFPGTPSKCNCELANVTCLCFDENPCTDDFCDANDVCQHVPVPGRGCGDPTDTECDNPDTCDADGVCQPNLESPTTPCRPGSGDICDPDESCDGAGHCPMDVVSPSTTICNPGSGDLCDPDESCTGVPGAACPADRIASATTICNPGSGDVCDPDESCSGVADATCPADRIASATTICNPGSGDVCDPPESCTGVADAACPADRVASATTICNPGSGDVCDPPESCSGVADATCPADRIASPTTICRTGSGDVCDPDESCTGVANATCPPDVRDQCPEGACFLLIDEDSIDNGNPPNFFRAKDVNDQLARLALRKELRFFDLNQGATITLHTGEVGDEGWFAMKTIPDSWAAAGPTSDGLRNFVGLPSLPYPHNVGPGLGTGSDPEALLDNIPDVTPLRATGLALLQGRQCCAVVYDSDISINYDPLMGNLQGANLGTVAFEVLDVRRLFGFSSSSLPEVDIRILDAETLCEGDLVLFTEAPEPISSSEPFDIDPGSSGSILAQDAGGVCSESDVTVWKANYAGDEDQLIVVAEEPASPAARLYLSIGGFVVGVPMSYDMVTGRHTFSAAMGGDVQDRLVVVSDAAGQCSAVGIH